MQPNNQPSAAKLAGTAQPGKLCRVCFRRYPYSPLHRWPDYCPTCVRSTNGRHHAASDTCLEDVSGAAAAAELPISSLVAGAPAPSSAPSDSAGADRAEDL